MEREIVTVKLPPRFNHHERRTEVLPTVHHVQSTRCRIDVCCPLSYQRLPPCSSGDLSYCYQSEAAHAEAAAHTPNARVSADGAPSHYGRYDLLGELGKGVQSVVYRAVESGSGREVALKIIKIRGSSIERQRVRREVEVRILRSSAYGHLTYTL